jgi:tRNA threonylcarbamoyladenosine biosynthesis protein TsaB
MTGPFLALDTATDVASVALAKAGAAPAVTTEAGARRHAAEIIPMIDRVLREAGVQLDQLTGIIVADGPGSFTGLRIGWAAAKGLAHERGIPLFTAPSLMAAAFRAWRSEVGEGRKAGEDGPVSDAELPVAACYDALRGQVFGAVYRFSRNTVEAVVAPALLTIAELARIAPSRPRIVTGDGAAKYADEVYVWTGRAPQTTERDRSSNTAASLCALATWNRAVEPVADPMTREPAYGRPAEAQAKWEAHHGRPLPHPSRAGR